MVPKACAQRLRGPKKGTALLTKGRVYLLGGKQAWLLTAALGRCVAALRAKGEVARAHSAIPIPAPPPNCEPRVDPRRRVCKKRKEKRRRVCKRRVCKKKKRGVKKKSNCCDVPPATVAPASVEPGKPSKEQAKNRLIWKEKKSMAAHFFPKQLPVITLKK